MGGNSILCAQGRSSDALLFVSSFSSTSCSSSSSSYISVSEVFFWGILTSSGMVVSCFSSNLGGGASWGSRLNIFSFRLRLGLA